MNPLRSALFTDLYELTMGEAYLAEGMSEDAGFELIFRKLPASRSFVVAAGIEDVLCALETFRFTDEDLAFLAEQDHFSARFLDRLADLRFTGDVDALPEGTLVFPNEPLLRVTAPILEAQLVETLVLNQVHFQSVAASKAARVVLAAEGRTVIDFGSRRAHGADAAVKVARASYLAGAAGTSNVLAGRLYGIPVFGTMAHSYVQAHDDEVSAFAAFAGVHPRTTLLVDTYDTLDGVSRAIDLIRGPGSSLSVRAIRLDSGDLAELARASRRMLDGAGLDEIKIFASSGLDEYEIHRLLEVAAPIDGFGVGTNMAVSADDPALDMAYKLVVYAGRPRTKLSSSKVIYPGPKQVFRTIEDGAMVQDTIGRADEDLPGERLLRPVMRRGRRVDGFPSSLEDARSRLAGELERLPETWRRIDHTEWEYPVHVSPALEDDLARLTEKLTRRRPSPLEVNGVRTAASRG